MDKTINIDYEPIENDEKRLMEIAEILSDGVYSYLKMEGLLSSNDEPSSRVEALLKHVKRIRLSAGEEKNQDTEKNT